MAEADISPSSSFDDWALIDGCSTGIGGRAGVMGGVVGQGFGIAQSTSSGNIGRRRPAVGFKDTTHLVDSAALKCV